MQMDDYVGKWGFEDIYKPRKFPVRWRYFTKSTGHDDYWADLSLLPAFQLAFSQYLPTFLAACFFFFGGVNTMTSVYKPDFSWLSNVTKDPFRNQRNQDEDFNLEKSNSKFTTLFHPFIYQTPSSPFSWFFWAQKHANGGLAQLPGWMFSTWLEAFALGPQAGWHLRSLDVKVGNQRVLVIS